MRRFEAALGGVLLAVWVGAGLFASGIVAPGARVPLDLFGHFTFAAAFGWVAGNLTALARRDEPRGRRRLRSLASCLLLAAPVALLRSLALPDLIAAAPFAGLYAGGVYALFFAVPITLKR